MGLHVLVILGLPFGILLFLDKLKKIAAQ